MSKLRSMILAGLLLFSIGYPGQGHAAFINASGYLGLLSSGLYNPHINALSGDYQTFEKYLSLDIEIQSGDLLTLYLDVRLWPQGGSLIGEEEGMVGAESDFYFYDDLTPTVTEFYVEAASNICLFNAGRRARTVGLGMFWYDAAEPFETQQTLFEGVSCEVHSGIQQLEVTLGMDKLREGDPMHQGDDLSQLFASIAYDDREFAPYALKKQVALYYAYVTSHKPHDFGQQKDKYLDIMAGLYWSHFSWETEGLIRMGKASGESWETYGGRPNQYSGLNALALYTTLKASFPAPYGITVEQAAGNNHNHDGHDNHEEHSGIEHEVFVEYIYSPGDEQGYFKGSDTYLTGSKRSDQISALPLNVNFKPALILFNMRTEDFDIDGIYSGDRIVNAHVFVGGYSLMHERFGEFHGKIIAALMDKEIPDFVYSYFYHNPIPEAEIDEDYYEFPEEVKVPVGFSGRYLGTEINLTYGYAFTDNLSFELTGGYLFGGSALQVNQTSPANTFAFDIAMLFTL